MKKETITESRSVARHVLHEPSSSQRLPQMSYSNCLAKWMEFPFEENESQWNNFVKYALQQLGIFPT